MPTKSKRKNDNLIPAPRKMSASSTILGGIVLAFFSLLASGIYQQSGDATPSPTSGYKATIVHNYAAPQPTNTKAPVRLASPTPITLVVRTKSLNIRTGPGTTYAILGTLNQDQISEVIGQTSNGEWVAIKYAGQTGWVAASLVDIRGVAPVIVLTSPPAPTSAPRQTIIRLAPTNTTSALPGPCPRNCTECRALGWSAVQCGKCSNLDRDKDGVACYND